MNISFLSNFNQNKNYGLQKQNRNMSYPNLRPLASDTVSFGSKANTAKEITTGIIGDKFLGIYPSISPILVPLKNKLHGSLDRVCNRLSNFGFSYDPVYNAKHPIKTEGSFNRKVMTQGSAKDLVRGTVYWKNQQNVEAFAIFNDEMKKEGWKIANYKKLNEKTGKLESFPDLEIRQDGVTQDDLKILSPFLQKAEISRPRRSTYADWQVLYTDGKNEVEVIFLYGPKYAEAKELESKYAYNITRSFRENFHIDLKRPYKEKTPGKRISDNISVIAQKLTDCISTPLFRNAKNAELGIKDDTKLKPYISKIVCMELDGLMNGIRTKIPLYYKDLKKQIKDDDYIIDYIKNSFEYKMREDKTISKDEIKVVRQYLKDNLIPSYEAEDIGTATTAHEYLKATIAKYGEK